MKCLRGASFLPPALFLAVLAGGCAAPPTPAPVAPPAPARLMVENRTPYAWHIAVGTKEFTVGPRAIVSGDLPAGDYAAVQERVGPEPRRPPARHLRVVLAPGQTYHWPIATVLNP